MKWWNDLKVRERIFLVLGLVIVLSTAYYFLLYEEKKAELELKKSQVEEAVSEIEQKRDTLRNKKRVMNSYQQLEEKLGYSDNLTYRESFLNSDEKPELIVSLNQQSLNYNINLVSLEAEEFKEGETYHRFPIKIRVEGPYDQVLGYLQNVKNKDYLTRVEKLELTSVLEPIDRVEADIRLLGYTRNDTKGGEGDVVETQFE